MNSRILLYCLGSSIIFSCNNSTNTNEKINQNDVNLDSNNHSNIINELTYTIQEVVDSIYKDTIEHRDYFDKSKVDTFYLREIQKLITQISKDKNNPKTLFPCVSFDNVIAQDILNSDSGIKLGELKQLNISQTKKLLNIVNNPLNYNWGENVVHGHQLPNFHFIIETKLSRHLILDAHVNSSQIHRKIKFGTLNNEKCSELMDLCHELGLTNK
ncbi:MAG: hypothetical protein IPO70_14780 [Bacteroidetes bacterium]|nr:hypothetical protein [Bacteroidota bacterium]